MTEFMRINAMLQTIISLNDVFRDENTNVKNYVYPSTNPYDYISDGYFIENRNIFGGDNNVSFKCDIYGNFAGNNSSISN